MSTKSGLIFLITSIILVLACIVGLIGVYYFDWLKPAKSNYALYTTNGAEDSRYAYKEEQLENNNDFTFVQNDLQDAVIPADKYINTENVNTSKDNYSFYELEDNAKNANGNQNAVISKVSYTEKPIASQKSKEQPIASKDSTANISKKSENVIKTNQQQKVAKPEPAKTNVSSPESTTSVAKSETTTSTPKVVNKTTTNPVKPEQKPFFTKAPAIGKDGSPIKIGFTFDKDRDFHSYGQYISADEYKYRLAVINNLTIKTIVIDSVSQGNGISQEYYKVAYNANMIPAKILDEIITSKEFRNLIPKQYLDVETQMSKFPKGGKVSFNNTDIKELLILWSQGKLTPTQKAWTVKAAM